MSINQLRLALGVQYKTAAHLTNRIRHAMERGTIELHPVAEEATTDGRATLPVALAPRREPQPVGQPDKLASPSPAPRAPVAAELAQRRMETANLLSELAPRPGTATASSSAVDNLLSMFVSLAQISVRPPLFFVNYLRDKVFT